MREYINYLKQNFILGFQRAWQSLGIVGKIIGLFFSLIATAVYKQEYIILYAIIYIFVALGMLILYGIFYSLFIVPFQEIKRKNKESAIGYLSSVIEEVQNLTNPTSNNDLRNLIINKLRDYKRAGRKVFLGQIVTWYSKNYKVYEIISELQFMEHDNIIEIQYTDKNKYIDPDLQIIYLL